MFNKLIAICILAGAATLAQAQSTSKVPDIFTHGCQVGIGIVQVHLKQYASYKHGVLVELCESTYSMPTVRQGYIEERGGLEKFSYACGVAVGVGLSVYKRQDILADEPTLAGLAEQCTTMGDMLQRNGYFNNTGDKK